MEEWKEVPKFEKLYEVSTLGRVRSLPRIVQCNIGKRITKKRMLKLNIRKDGYCRVVLFKNCNRTTVLLSRLVLMAFRPNIEFSIFEANHIDCNKGNNLLSNLEWVTPSENMKHALAMGRINIPSHRKFNKEQVIKIRSMYPMNSIRSIAKELRICRIVTGNIIKRRTYKEI